MATRTTNLYGKIAVANRAIRSVVDATIKEAYGVAGGFCGKLVVENNRLFLTTRIFLKYGVNPAAVTDSLRTAIKYNVEKFAGAPVALVNISVVGIR